MMIQCRVEGEDDGRMMGNERSREYLYVGNHSLQIKYIAYKRHKWRGDPGE